MQLEWINYPITQYSLTGVGLISSIVLWASAKVEIHRVQRIMGKSLAQLENGVTTLNASLDDVRKTREATPEPVPASAVPAPAMFMQGLNLTKRAQILRMKRRGENIHSIAAALQLPLGEVTLILKMDNLQVSRPEQDTNTTPQMARGVL
jgi:hypothetical protein